MNTHKLVLGEYCFRQFQGNSENGRSICRRSRTGQFLVRTPKQQANYLHSICHCDVEFYI